MKSIKLLIALLLLVQNILGRNNDSDTTDSRIVSVVHEVSHATKKALVDPVTIGVTALALGIYFFHTDSDISQWATSHNPIYRSQATARNASDILQVSSFAVYGITYIIKNHDYKSHSLKVPLIELSYDASAILSTLLVTYIAKYNCDRLRPNGSDTQSFPSGHTSFASINATLASDDINDMNLSKGTKFLLNSCLFAMVAGTAWARVEGKEHYATDVLAGAALGHFFGEFFDDLHKQTNLKKPGVSVFLEPNGCNLNLSFSF